MLGATRRQLGRGRRIHEYTAWATMGNDEFEYGDLGGFDDGDNGGSCELIAHSSRVTGDVHGRVDHMMPASYTVTYCTVVGTTLQCAVYSCTVTSPLYVIMM